jgi:DNA polymerase III sliding clamp (beta) subunit (PCNA family)
MIPQSDFYKALKCASCFIDPKLPGLHVVHFNFKTPEAFELVATDGHRLVTIEFSAPHACPPGTRVSVPLPMVEDVLKMFPEMDDVDGIELTLAYWENKLLLTNGINTHMVQGPPPGDYPPYLDVIKEVSPLAGQVYLNPKLLAKILKDCTPLSAAKPKEDPTRQITPRY